MKQYDLYRKPAKIPALSSNNFDKYEYLTGEDLGLKPSTVEQARFEYSPLSKFLNKGLKEEEKGEGSLKILKNIEGKNKKQLKAIEDQGKKQLNGIKNINTDSKLLKVITSFSRLGFEAEKLIDEIKEEQNAIDFDKLLCAKAGGKIHFNFGIFEDFYYKGSLKDEKDGQYKMFTEENTNQLKKLQTNKSKQNKGEKRNIN